MDIYHAKCFSNFFWYAFQIAFFAFSQKYPFFGKAWQKSPKKSEMASKNPRNGPHMLKTFEIFDFQQEIIG